MIEAGWLGSGGELGQGGGEVGLGRTGAGLEALFGESPGVENHSYDGRRGGREDFDGERPITQVVEGEASAVRCTVFSVSSFGNGVEMAAGDTGLEDEVFMSFGDTTAIIDDDEDSIAASPQRGSDEDVASAGVARVSQHLEESLLNGAQSPRATTNPFDARQAGEARAQVPVWSFQSVRAA